MSVLHKKARTVQEENRSFNEKWEEDYIMIPIKDKMLCLLCDLTIATLKNATAKRHLKTFIRIIKDAYYSIALDESTDVTDSAQLLFFIRVITADFKSYEELFALAKLKGKTRGCDIISAFKEKICQAQLQLKNLVRICSDGAPSIRANSSRHRQFQNLLQSDEETYSVDLPYYSKVRWLSQGLVLQKLLELRKQIEEFFTSQKELLTCKTKSIYEMWQQIQVFKKKLVFLKDVISKSNLSTEHFPELTKIILEQKNEKKLENNDISRYKTVLSSLIAEFNDRFKDFEEYNETMKLAFQPHLVEISTAPEYLQMELIDFLRTVS
ncbi:general transcription factor II-I repeat domain-containing protein 2-like [Hydra vulgaris]|uniref:General transcription factor II-I repeat domain-containing protein 2-like n=1 Tax=Hydra vulgaris TaxID=6087 RepID=A0ABM4CS36_HYDVU